jgi:hypothetical protein
MIQAVGRVNPASVAVADAVKAVADAIGASSAQVAIAWTLANPALSAPVLGARTVRQLDDNLGALAVTLDVAQRARLDDASRIDPGFPHDFLQNDFNSSQSDRRHQHPTARDRNETGGMSLCDEISERSWPRIRMSSLAILHRPDRECGVSPIFLAQSSR